MRDVKFRAWDKDSKKMYNSDSIAVAPNNGRFSEWCISGDGITIRVDSERFILMQYTGRKDKNGKGKEAYHHDIIETSVATPWDRGVSITIKGEIVWKNSGWWFRGFKSNEWDCHLSDLGYFEVIGNIHSKPKLLENNQDD